MPAVRLALSVRWLAEVSSAASFRTREALRDAVNEWCANETLARNTYGEIGSWDVSRVNNMNLLFNDRFEFNSDISGWDVSGVTSMNHMFDNARSFNIVSATPVP